MILKTIIEHADAGLALTLARDIVISKSLVLGKQKQSGTRTRRKLDKALEHLDSARNLLDEVVCELFQDRAAPSVYYAAHRLREIVEPSLISIASMKEVL